VTTEQARSRLNAQIDAAYFAARGSGRGIRDAILDAQQAVMQTPVDPDVRRWLDAALAALEVVRARFASARNDEGWELGGIATVRNLVEAVRDELAR
jgi:hypothetical protein